MRSACTFYVDDGHLCFQYSSVEQIENGLRCFGIVLDLLSAMGMTVNLSKSAALLELKGAWKSWTCKTTGFSPDPWSHWSL